MLRIRDFFYFVEGVVLGPITQTSVKDLGNNGGVILLKFPFNNNTDLHQVSW